MPKKHSKYFYIKPNGQIVVLIPKYKRHPVKSLVKVFETFNYSVLTEEERNDLERFIKKLKELVKLL